MSVEEVDALPWWQRRLYVEGLEEEFAPPENNGAGGRGPQHLATSTAPQGTPQGQQRPRVERVGPVGDDEWAARGVKIRKG